MTPEERKAYLERIRAHMAAQSPAWHRSLYRDCYRAYLINKGGGYKEQMRFSHQQMKGVLAYNKITPQEVRRIQRSTRTSLRLIAASLDAFIAGRRSRGCPESC